jgi:hypothetical protein
MIAHRSIIQTFHAVIYVFGLIPWQITMSMQCDPVDVGEGLCLIEFTLRFFYKSKHSSAKASGGTMRLPKIIYEVYPALYILGGIATMSTVHSSVAFWSGLVLGLSGTIILFLRRNYRAIRQQLQHSF